MSLKEFGKNAVALGGRPIGIIALFILLVYGAFSATLISGSNLNEIHIYLIIAFMMLFSCLVLYVFYKLVTKHSGKLFSPKDFKDEQYFFEIVREKLHEEISTDVAVEINKRIAHLEQDFKFETLYIRMLNAKSQDFNSKALSYAEELVNLKKPTSDLMKLKAFFLGNLKQYTQALEAIEESLSLDEFKDDFERAKAKFNRACYKSMLGHSPEQIYPDLEYAISIDRVFIAWCRDDDELKNTELSPLLSRYTS